jgi:hypothetical protein
MILEYSQFSPDFYSTPIPLSLHVPNQEFIPHELRIWTRFREREKTQKETPFSFLSFVARAYKKLTQHEPLLVLRIADQTPFNTVRVQYLATISQKTSKNKKYDNRRKETHFLSGLKTRLSDLCSPGIS